ncbi:MAG: glycosyltransferase family 2 protein [Desulfobulbaceae bacterium]|nr:glycosyltransferase family 2 protein [Desulfobulbaceae bacterium]
MLPTISIVIPAYNERGNIMPLWELLAPVLEVQTKSWEVIFVDDGSDDDTWQIIVSLSKGIPGVQGVRLSKNFGHQYALLAGLSRAKGQAVITMDADLQHPVDVLPKLIDAWKNGYKIVQTIRQEPQDFSFFKKVSSKLFYRVFSYCSGVEIRSGMADFRLLDRQVLDDILQMGERSIFLRGLVQWTGYPRFDVHYQAQQRYSGSTTYSVTRMLRFAWHSIVSFSTIPLRLAIILGFLTSAVAFSGIIYALYSKYIAQSAVSGWTSSVSIISFLMGVMFILLGLIGEYVGRILLEAKGRPRFIVSEKTPVNNSLRMSNLQ